MSAEKSDGALKRSFRLWLLTVLFNGCIACLPNTGASILLSAPASSQAVKIDVSMSNQTLEGWGTSLAWFANSVGSWTNTTNQNSLMSALFSPSSGLGLNYLRYNIPGGNDPLCSGGQVTSATNEHWNVVAVGDGSYRIVNVNSGLDLEVNGTTGVVDQWQDVSGATNEHWTLTMTN